MLFSTKMQVSTVTGSGGVGGSSGSSGSSRLLALLLTRTMIVITKTITRRIIVMMQHFRFLSSFRSLAACSLSKMSEYLGAFDLYDALLSTGSPTSTCEYLGGGCSNIFFKL